MTSLVPPITSAKVPITSSTAFPAVPNMSRFETPPRTRATNSKVLTADPSKLGLQVKFKAILTGDDLGLMVVKKDTTLKDVCPSLKACLTSRPSFQISLTHGNEVYDEA